MTTFCSGAFFNEGSEWIGKDGGDDKGSFEFVDMVPMMSKKD